MSGQAAGLRSSQKRPRTTGSDTNKSTQASLTSATTSTDDERPTKISHTVATAPSPSTSTSDDSTADPAWSKVYAPLPSAMQLEVDYTQQQLETNKTSANVNVTVGAPSDAFIPGFIASLLPATTQFETNFNSKLKDKNLMLDNTTNKSTSGETAAKLEKKRRRKRGVQMMSSNKRKEAGLSQIPKENIKYSMFLPMHHLWIAYMHDILDPSHARGLSIGERVLKADYHGAIFTVIRCRSPTHIGQRGIMIQETQETFQIVTENNAIKILPKRHTVFSFTVPPSTPATPTTTSTSSSSTTTPTYQSTSLPSRVFELFGDHLCFRSYERSSRKFKSKATIQL